jgi:ethanolamine-phosphate cytidylyltransferase
MTLFSNHKEPKPNDRIVYIDGDFDMMHLGHVEALKKAKAMGDFLYIGIHDDNIVHDVKGINFPILSLNERVLMVLANQYVDDVIMGAPFGVTDDLIKTFNIQVVV